MHVPAKDIPTPTSISPEAQAILAMGPLSPEPSYPALGDLAGWKQWVTEQDAGVIAMLEPRAAAVSVTRERRDVEGVTVNVVAPAGCDDDRVVFHMHSGGLMLMGGEACALLAALASDGYGLPLWSVDYRMPPDHPYPAGLDDCVTAYRALLAERDPQQIVVAGESAGGNLAPALLLRARDEGLPMPAALVLGTPEVDLTESGDTFQTNVGIDTVLRPLMPVNVVYAAGHDLAHRYLSPLFGDLTGFPPTILTSGTRDVFLSNTVRMHRALRRAGTEAELHVLEAAPHGGFLGAAPEDAELAAEVRRFIDAHCIARSG